MFTPPTFTDFLNSLPLPSSSPFPIGYTSSLRKSSLSSTYSKSIAIHKELSQLDYNVTHNLFYWAVPPLYNTLSILSSQYQHSPYSYSLFESEFPSSTALTPFLHFNKREQYETIFNIITYYLHFIAVTSNDLISKCVIFLYHIKWIVTKR